MISSYCTVNPPLTITPILDDSVSVHPLKRNISYWEICKTSRIFNVKNIHKMRKTSEELHWTKFWISSRDQPRDQSFFFKGKTTRCETTVTPRSLFIRGYWRSETILRRWLSKYKMATAPCLHDHSFYWEVTNELKSFKQLIEIDIYQIFLSNFLLLS